jgi:hypothetical protein
MGLFEIIQNFLIQFLVKKGVSGCSFKIFQHNEVNRFLSFFMGPNFFYIKEWGQPVHYIILFFNISAPNVIQKRYLEFPVF